jgi:Na+/H+ antiporter NhaD/arsenite permease-like protein
LIGNVTNIYLAESAGISFFDYFKVMWLPSTLSSLVGLGVTLAIFGRKLSAPIDGGLEPIHHVKDKDFFGLCARFLRRLHHRLNDQQLYPYRDVFLSFWVHGVSI